MCAPQRRSALHALDFGLGSVVVRLGLVGASALGVAGQVIALFLGDFIRHLGLLFRDLLGVLVRRLVVLLQLGLGNVLRALGLLFADVLGVVLQGVALGLRDFVVGRDLLFGNVVLVLGHCVGACGGEEAASQCDPEKMLFHSVSFEQVTF